VDYRPYVNLWLEVFMSAIRDATYGQKGERVRGIRWLTSRRTDVGSMIWVCDMLGVDPQPVIRLASTREGRAHMADSIWQKSVKDFE
jgi:hypothetical protein